MQIKYLGTAAYEGVPALFCDCEVCRKSRNTGGRALRTRSQALIDGRLLLDFNADTFCHCLTYGLNIQNIEHCLITHAHSDHLYAEDISMLREGYAHPKKGYTITFYGTEVIANTIKNRLQPGVMQADKPLLHLKTIKPFDSFRAGEYQIVAYPAVHDKASGPLFYQVSNGEKTLLYAHDTGYFSDSVWDYFKKHKVHFDFVSLDCTCGNSVGCGCHMGLGEDVKIKTRMLEEGFADSGTAFVASHFSHNGIDAVYDDFVPIALENGILTAFDGMCIDF